jgi:hypothetical protein
MNVRFPRIYDSVAGATSLVRRPLRHPLPHLNNQSTILVDPSLCLPQGHAIGLFATLADFSRFTIHCREMFLSSN